MPRKQPPVPVAWQNRIVGLTNEPPTELMANPRNWRRHPEAQSAALRGILGQIGWITGVIKNDQTGHLIDGHDRMENAIATAQPTVPVLHVSLTQAEEDLALATFDPLGAMAQQDDAMLSALLADLSVQDSGLSDMLRDLAPAVPKVLHEDDADLTPPAEPVTRPGDLWLLGEHRLLCGDSTRREDVEWLIAGRRADVVLTDPPYNVDYDYGETTDDDKNRAEYLAWTRRWFPLAQTLTDHCVVLTCGIINLPMWIADVERTHRIIAWVKENQNSRNYIGKTSGFNVWEPILVYGKAKKCVARDSFSIPIGMQIAADGHPCPKSLDAWSRLVEDFTEQGDLIVDPFMGSGTTIIAAEQLSRQAYGLEISPAYCDLTVRRWENLTGRKAVRDGKAVKA